MKLEMRKFCDSGFDIAPIHQHNEVDLRSSLLTAKTFEESSALVDRE
jgi:hypothetical protein